MPDRNLTIENLADWIIANRRKKAFKDWSKKSLMAVFYVKLQRHEAAYTTDEEGNLTGVVVIDTAPDYKRVHVGNILTTSKKAFKQFIKLFQSWYPGWDIQGYRRDEELILYNTPKFIKKVEGLC